MDTGERSATAEPRDNPIGAGQAPRQYRYAAIRILIVDDDPGFVGVAAELLAARGFEVIGRAGDADQALAAMTKDRPDGILLDVNLPGRELTPQEAQIAMRQGREDQRRDRR